MNQLKNMRGDPERPCEAVRIISSTAMRHRLFQETSSRFGEAHQQMGLPGIQPANHTRMLAIDREFRIGNAVGKCRTLGKDFYRLS